MNAIFFAILLTCSAILSGCSCRDQSSQQAPAKRMIRVEDLTANKETLTLDYRVSNPFRYGIWVCEDIDVHGNYDVETRVAPEILRIKLRLNLDSNLTYRTELFAKYRFLSPGESHSGRIVLTLPVRNASPVYVFSFGEDRTKYKQVVLQRAAFEIGYIKSTHLTRDLKSVKRPGRPVPSSSIIVGLPELRQETIEGKLRKFAIVPHTWLGRAEEKSAKVAVTNVEIPCLIQDD